ncbi:hypothetical protein ONZ45_g6371 [Pleurotus djamor]|nr:hypothetical protein ONZ45_g6371 [Pleurotus djamor]
MKAFRRILFNEGEDERPLSYSYQIPGFLPSKCVRNLWMQEHCDGVRKMLSSCVAVENIAMTQQIFVRSNATWLFVENQSTVVSNTKPIRLLIFDPDERWNLATRYLTQNHFAGRITHLHLAKSIPLTVTPLDTTSFSNLTHIAFPSDTESDILNMGHVNQLLRDTSLIMLVLVLYDEDPCPNQIAYDLTISWVKLCRRTGISNVFLAKPSKHNLRSDWENDVRGKGPNIWDLAIDHTKRMIEQDPS